MNLVVDNLAFSFGEVHALKGVSLTLQAGQVSVIVGPNGAGKSTLMSLILGLLTPSSGRLVAQIAGDQIAGEQIAGEQIAGEQAAAAQHSADLTEHVVADSSKPTALWLRDRMGYLPEAASFSANLSGYQVLRFFASARGVARSEISPTLARVGLAEAANRRVGGYSRGMRQRLGLAVSILHKPELLILDEPTGGLDQHGLKVLWEVLTEWREAGRTVLLSTHELALIERRSDILYVIAGGELRASGTPDQLRDQAGLPEEWRKGPGLDEVYEHLIRSEQ